MRYPKKLEKGEKIGITAPSLGVTGDLSEMLDQGIHSLEQLGFQYVETASVRKIQKAASASPRQRAEEFMELYLNHEVKAIIPARGGELLMDMLPYLDYEQIKGSTPKWILGFSDISTLLFTLTLKCDISTAHGPILLHFGGDPINESALNAINILQGGSEFEQKSIGCYEDEFAEQPDWMLLGDMKQCKFSGRLIGGGLDTIRSLIGTPYAPVQDFIKKYENDGFVWYMESCSMKADDIYKTLWQMKMNGWFKNCKGVLYGRPDGYSDFHDFSLVDALNYTFLDLDVPIIYNVDLGHIYPQLTFINGAFATIEYKDSKAKIIQRLI